MNRRYSKQIVLFQLFSLKSATNHSCIDKHAICFCYAVGLRVGLFLVGDLVGAGVGATRKYSILPVKKRGDI